MPHNGTKVVIVNALFFVEWCLLLSINFLELNGSDKVKDI